MKRARTVLAAVNDDFLDGVVDWVTGDARLQVVGRAHSGLEALKCVASRRAELVLVDVSLPDVHGFEVTRRIKSLPEAPLVVLLSFHDSRAARQEGRSAGADGFVATSETALRLLPLVGELLRRRTGGAAPFLTPHPSLAVPPAGPC